MENFWVSIETVQALLGVKRSTAFKYMKKYGIPKEKDFFTGKTRYFWPTIKALVRVGKPGNPNLHNDLAHQRRAAYLRWHPREKST